LADYIVAVVGLGKIGLPLAAQYASCGLRVIGCDISEEVVRTVNEGRSHVKEEPGLAELVASAVNHGLLSATTDTADAVGRSNVVVVIVPLMVDDEHNLDYRAVDAATEAVGKGLKPGTLVIYETTLPVGTTSTRFGPALERISGLRVGRDFHLAFSPERVYSGRVFRDLKQYHKVLGGVTAGCTERALDFYGAALGGAAVMAMSNADTAEFVKLMETTYRDVNIALANEFARFAGERGLSVDEAIIAANTQPFSHIHKPGIGVGGHCIPVYPYFLISAAEGDEMSIPMEARRVNDRMAGWALDRLDEALGGLRDKRVLLFGLSYRENVKETAFSTATRLIKGLRERGATPVLNDPHYAPDELAHYADEIFALETPAPCDAAIMQACHTEYKGLDWKRLAGMGCRVVLDGRNCLDRAEIEGAGMVYLGVGR
jgi:nucleotide sugar dehydrogenase